MINNRKSISPNAVFFCPFCYYAFELPFFFDIIGMCYWLYMLLLKERRKNETKSVTILSKSIEHLILTTQFYMMTNWVLENGESGVRKLQKLFGPQYELLFF